MFDDLCDQDSVFGSDGFYGFYGECESERFDYGQAGDPHPPLTRR
jgi:hypothetical protein